MIVDPAQRRIRFHTGDSSVKTITRLDRPDRLRLCWEDRALIPFFKEAPPSLWPRAVVIEHLSRDEWQQDCVADMIARGYREAGRTRSNTLLKRD